MTIHEKIRYSGKHSYGLDQIVVHHWEESSEIHVGSFCSIARTHVLLGGNHRVDWFTTYPFGHLRRDEFPNGSTHGALGHPAKSDDVVIGNDCWVGHDAMLLSGARLEDGAVLGARAVLAGRAEAYGVYVGNPARLVKKRFDDEIIGELLRIRWWEWPDEEIDRVVPILQSVPTVDLLDVLRQTRSFGSGVPAEGM